MVGFPKLLRSPYPRSSQNIITKFRGGLSFEIGLSGALQAIVPNTKTMIKSLFIGGQLDSIIITGRGSNLSRVLPIKVFF